MKNLFLTKWQAVGVGEKVDNWNKKVLNFWNYEFISRMKDIDNNDLNSLFKRCFDFSVMSYIFDQADVKNLDDISTIINSMESILDKNLVEKDKVLIIEKYLIETLGLFFLAINHYKLDNTYPNSGSRRGALTEVDVFLNFLPNKLKNFYFDEMIGADIIISTVRELYFGHNIEKISNQPFLGGYDSFRNPDLSNWVFVDIQQSKAYIQLQPIKHGMERYQMKDTIIDLLSSLYLQVRYNLAPIDRRNKKSIGEPVKFIDAEGSLLNLRYVRKSTYDDYFTEVLNILEELSFYDLIDSHGVVKVSKRLLKEEKILDILNEAVWRNPKNIEGHLISLEKYRKILLEYAKDIDFIKENIIIPFTGRPGFTSLDLVNIQNFIYNLAENLNTLYTSWNKIDGDKLIEVNGIERISSYRYYRVSAKNNRRLSDFIEFNSIFLISSDGTGYDKVVDRNTILDRSFKIIRNDLTGEYALVEVSFSKLMQNPSGYSDGYVINNYIFRNALLTDHYGNLLSSQFYNVESEKFEYRTLKELNFEILKNGYVSIDNVKAGINLLIDFSKSDSNYYMNSLIVLNLLNPALYGDQNHQYQLPIQPDYFKKLYDSHLKGYRSRSSQLVNKVNYKFTPIKNLDINPDIFYKIYFNLFEFSSTKKRVANMFVLEQLGILNMRFNPQTGYVMTSSHRDYHVIVQMINKLFNTEVDLRKFLFKDPKGNLLPQSKYSLKEWIIDIYNKIVSYTDQSEEISEVSPLILKAKDLLSTISLPSLSYDRRIFKIDEIEDTKKIFNIISNLFGHFTIRLIFMQMVEFYGEAGNFKLDITTSSNLDNIAEYLDNFNIKSATQTLGQRDISLTDTSIIKNHLFSLFFLNSFMYLPVEASIPKHLSQAIYLGYSPLPFISTLIEEKKERSFNRAIENEFFLSYNKYYTNYYLKKGSKDTILELFQHSGEELLNKLIPILEKEVFESKRFNQKSIAEKEVIFSKLVFSAINEIFSGGYRIGSGRGTDGLYNLRFQVENLLIGYADQGNVFEREIIFHNVIVDGVKFSLKLNKEQFMGSDAKIWRTTLKNFNLGDFSIERFNKHFIQNKVKILKSIIKQNEGRVKIFTCININNEYGLQYLFPPNDYSSFPYIPHKVTPGILSPSYFEIDFVKDPVLAEIQLQYIVRLLTCQIPTPLGNDLNIFTFVMKSIDSDSSTKEMICAFDYKGFYRYSSIYSPLEYTVDTRRYKYERVILDKLAGTFDYTKANKIWSLSPFFFPISVKYFLEIYNYEQAFQDIKTYLCK